METVFLNKTSADDIIRKTTIIHEISVFSKRALLVRRSSLLLGIERRAVVFRATVDFRAKVMQSGSAVCEKACNVFGPIVV
jgi:hypothetical protein